MEIKRAFFLYILIVTLNAVLMLFMFVLNHALLGHEAEYLVLQDVLRLVVVAYLVFYVRVFEVLAHFVELLNVELVTFRYHFFYFYLYFCLKSLSQLNHRFVCVVLRFRFWHFVELFRWKVCEVAVEIWLDPDLLIDIDQIWLPLQIFETNFQFFHHLTFD